MKDLTVKEVLQGDVRSNSEVMVQGWVRGKRVGKRVGFVMLQDGTSQVALQVVIGSAVYPKNFSAVTIGASVAVLGRVVTSQGKGQKVEIQASQVILLGEASSEVYPLQPKRHSMEFLRSIQHLRFRTNVFGAVFRIRHGLSFAIHDFFNQKGFCYVHTPVITSMDAEGAGELFDVHTQSKSGGDFFHRPVHLTVSGQLAAEAAIFGLRSVYTFGPTFRAENSNTRGHLAEFWMVEPEMAFCDLEGCIDVAEDLIRYVLSYVLKHYSEELKFLSEYKKQGGGLGEVDLVQRLEAMSEHAFVRIDYSEAFALLKEASTKSDKPFEYPVDVWGVDFQKEHERYLVEYFGCGVVVRDYPKEIKPFYMRANDDGRTVSCMDIFLPIVGEVVGGSQREERYERLEGAIREKAMDIGSLEWYLDTRRFGSVVHSGFGMGLDRLVQFVTGMDNIRDVVPFPRTPGHAMC